MEISFEQRRELGFQYVLDLLAPCSPYGAELVRKPRFFAPREREALEAEWANVQAAIDGCRALARNTAGCACCSCRSATSVRRSGAAVKPC